MWFSGREKKGFQTSKNGGKLRFEQETPLLLRKGTSSKCCGEEKIPQENRYFKKSPIPKKGEGPRERGEMGKRISKLTRKNIGTRVLWEGSHLGKKKIRKEAGEILERKRKKKGIIVTRQKGRRNNIKGRLAKFS